MAAGGRSATGIGRVHLTGLRRPRSRTNCASSAAPATDRRPPPVGDDHQLGRHQREVMIGLVPVGARAEVHLRDGVESVPGHGVHQRRELDAIANRDGQRLHQVAPGGPLPRQRLHHAGQLGPPQADQRPRDQLGDAAAFGRGRAVRLGPHPGVEALDQPHIRRCQQRPDQPGDEVRTPAGQVGVDEDEQVAVGDVQRLPQRLALAGEAAGRRQHVRRAVHHGPGPRCRPAAVASVESESITTSSSTSGTASTSERAIAPTTAATVRCSFLAGMTTLIVAPLPLLGRQQPVMRPVLPARRAAAEPGLSAVVHDLASLIEAADRAARRASGLSGRP